MTTTTIDLDRQRAEFEETYFGLYPSAVHATPSKFERDESGDYIDAKVFVGWDIWQAALARRSNAGEAAAQPVDSVALNLEAQLRAVVRERDELRATLATQQAAREQQEPAKCPHCGTREVAMHRVCHNSACTAYAAEETIYEGWKSSLAAPVAQQSEAGARTPTEAMLNAARDWSVKKYGLGIGDDAAIGCWQAMYDAQPTEAGTPTAAASFETWWTMKVIECQGRPFVSRREAAQEAWQAATSGRESAAPGAQQDEMQQCGWLYIDDDGRGPHFTENEKYAGRYLHAWPIFKTAPSDGHVCDYKLGYGQCSQCEAIDAAMQKGAQ